MDRFDVAISFASEDRDVAKEINFQLKRFDISTFYDDDHIADLWGSNLAETLKEVYFEKCTFCLMLVSQWYLKKQWTRHERRAAISRMIRQKSDYILPYFLDKTKIENIPGINPDTHYITNENTNAFELTKIIYKKLRRKDDWYDHVMAPQYALKIVRRVYECNPKPYPKYPEPCIEWHGLKKSILFENDENIVCQETSRHLDGAVQELLHHKYIFVVVKDMAGVWLGLTEKGVAFIDNKSSVIDLFAN